MKVVTASSFDLPVLTKLFNDGFSGYSVPMCLSEQDFREHVSMYDIDLSCSCVVTDHGPVAFAHLGRRGSTAWIGGMGTIPSHRRRGLGEAALVATIEAARRQGCEHIGLEVITTNTPAIKLYQKLGFVRIRDLAVWSLPPVELPVECPTAVGFDDAHTWITTHRHSPVAWQCADKTLLSLQREGIDLKGFIVKRDGNVVAAAVIRERPERMSVLQIAAVDEDAASALLAGSASCRTLTLSNVPLDEPPSRAIERLGASRVVLQHDMELQR